MQNSVEDISPNSCFEERRTLSKSAHSDASDESNFTCVSSQDTTGPLLNGKNHLPGKTMDHNARSVCIPYDEEGQDKRTNAKRKEKSRRNLIILAVGLVTFVVGLILITVAVVLLFQSQCSRDSQTLHGDAVDTTRPTSWPHQQNYTDRNGYTDKTNYSRTVTIVPTTASSTSVKSPSTLPRVTTLAYDTLENLAEGKSASQSSTVAAAGSWYPASNAVDGRTDSTIKSGSCSQTDEEIRPYWIVDVGQLTILRTVRILRPTDCCGGDLSNFEVRIGQSENPDFNVLCRRISVMEHEGSLVTVRCDNSIYGRYVSIRRIEETLSRLTLCEVMVYGQ